MVQGDAIGCDRLSLYQIGRSKDGERIDWGAVGKTE